MGFIYLELFDICRVCLGFFDYFFVLFLLSFSPVWASFHRVHLQEPGDISVLVESRQLSQPVLTGGPQSLLPEEGVRVTAPPLTKASPSSARSTGLTARSASPLSPVVNCSSLVSEWKECPKYIHSNRECFFDKNHTSVWTNYCMQLRSHNVTYSDQDYCFFVENIGTYHLHVHPTVETWETVLLTAGIKVWGNRTLLLSNIIDTLFTWQLSDHQAVFCVWNSVFGSGLPHTPKKMLACEKWWVTLDEWLQCNLYSSIWITVFPSSSGPTSVFKLDSAEHKPLRAELWCHRKLGAPTLCRRQGRLDAYRVWDPVQGKEFHKLGSSKSQIHYPPPFPLSTAANWHRSI